jgi:hypothetical protein
MPMGFMNRICFWLLFAVACTVAAHAAPAAPGGELRVTAETLYRAYHANEVAANLQYKGKSLRISGVVESINVDFEGSPYIKLRVGQFNSVNLLFDQDTADQLSKIQKGYFVNDQTCVGKGMHLGTPVVDCRLMTIEKTAPISNSRVADAARQPDAEPTQGPTKVTAADGTCIQTTIISVGHRLQGNGPDAATSGSAITLSGGLWLGDYAESEVIHRSRPGDQVTLCQLTTETGCPAGSAPTRSYLVLNPRLSSFWVGGTSSHMCSGA